MAGPGQWGVKGVDEESRERARVAAQRAGLTLGAWIERAIRGATALPEAVPVAVEAQTVEAADAPPAIPLQPTDRAPAVGPATAPDIAPDRDDRPLYVASERPVAPSGRGRRLLALVGGIGAIVLLVTGAGVWFYRETVPPSRPPSRLTVAANSAPLPGASPASVPPVAVTTAPPPTSTADETALPAVQHNPAQPPDPLRQAAEAGDLRAQYDLGVRLAAGRGMARDDAEAARWFERAAVRGLAQAQYNLGVMYDRGLGVAQSPKLAFFWYESAAEQGYAKAEHNLATAYADGRGTPRDLDAAARWFRRAADTGLAPAQFALAKMYEKGTGVTPDPARARALYRAAAAQGDARAAERLAALGNGTVDAAAAKGDAPSAEPTDPAVVAPSRETVVGIQHLLKRLRFDPGPADGTIGPRTREAIATYQRFAGRPETGAPSAALYAELQAVVAEMGVGK